MLRIRLNMRIAMTQQFQGAILPNFSWNENAQVNVDFENRLASQGIDYQ